MFHVRRRMESTGVDFCLDVHGDEALPYNFIAGPTASPPVSARVHGLQDEFERLLMRTSPDFQTEHGYDARRPGAANMTMCTTFIADHFGCLSMTLEQPFKDTVDSPHELFRWSPERCRKLGRANLDRPLRHPRPPALTSQPACPFGHRFRTGRRAACSAWSCLSFGHPHHERELDLAPLHLLLSITSTTTRSPTVKVKPER